MFAPIKSWSATWSSLTWLSPFFPFWCARDTVYILAPHKFWTTLLASNLVAWICLSLASSGLSNFWKDSHEAPSSFGD
jgi:hypothetical protein